MDKLALAQPAWPGAGSRATVWVGEPVGEKAERAQEGQEGAGGTGSPRPGLFLLWGLPARAQGPGGQGLTQAEICYLRDWQWGRWR